MRVIDYSREGTEDSLTKLESEIRTLVFPKPTVRVSPGDIERSVLEFLARLGGLNTK